MTSSFNVRQASGYEQLMGRWSKRLAPQFIAFAGLADGERIVDVGCGTGTFACLLAGQGLEVVGVDPALASLDVARGKPGADAVRWIHDAGGIAVIAHPGRYRFTPLQQGVLFDEFKDLGGEAIEVVTGSHTPDQYPVYAKLANAYGFLASRGTDFHAPGEARVDFAALPPLPASVTPVWHDWF